jgi:HPt (histidine-containing phosphotransfer) domain-containing protein
MTGEEYTQSISDHLHNAYMLSEDKIQEVMPRFLDTLLTHLENLHPPLETNNLSELGRAGHTLKGALLNLGLLELAEIAYTIEKQCNAGDETTDYQAMVKELQLKIRSFTTR